MSSVLTMVIRNVTREGDRWDLLAWEYYGDATAYERIVAANPAIPILPILPSGLTVMIPVQDAAAATVTPEGLPPWKR
jgi:phage tail protein X